MTRSVWTVAVVVVVSACAQLPPERQLVADAAAALGGRERVEAVRSLRIEGEGESPNVGQNTMPAGELPVWKVTDYVRTIDLVNGRAATRQTRTAQFLFANAGVQRQHQGIDGAVAYNVNAGGEASRASDQEAGARRVDLLHHPLTVVRAALADGATVTNLRQEGEDDIVDVRTAAGDLLTLAVSRATHLPARVTTMTTHANLGDVAITTAFSGYADTGGLMLPARLVTTIDKYPQFDLRIVRSTVDVDTADLEAASAVKASPAPAPPAIRVDVQPVARGIWWLAGSGNHRSIVFEFDDHLVLFEAPLNEARSKAVIDAARALSSKPLTHAVVSHHHFDHSGGLRVAVAEGLTIITQSANEAFFKDLVSRPHTIAPDALARNPKAMTLQLVDDTLTLKDRSMEVQLYHLLDNPREGTNLFAYVPRERMLVQADLYDNTWQQHLWGENVLQNIEKRKLRVDRHVPVHGAIEPFADMVRNIKTKTGLKPGA